MPEAIEHSGIRVGKPIIVQRDGNTYFIPPLKSSKIVRTEVGNYYSKEAVSAEVDRYFGLDKQD